MKSKQLPKFQFVAMMKCLFGSDAFSAVKTINRQNHISIHCLPRRVCAVHLFKQPKRSLTHMCGVSLLARERVFCQRNPPFSLAPKWLFANQRFFKQRRKPHYMPDCNWCLWLCRAPPSTAVQLAQGRRPSSCEEKSPKQHAPLLLLHIKPDGGEAKQSHHWDQQQSLNPVVAVHPRRERKTDEEKPRKHPPSFVTNVCCVVKCAALSDPSEL